MPRAGRPKSCPPDLPIYSPLFPSSHPWAPGRRPPPCGTASHVLDAFSGSDIQRSPAQRTAAATALPSPNNPIVALRPGVASIRRPGPRAGPLERLPAAGRGSGDRGPAPGRRRSRPPPAPAPAPSDLSLGARFSSARCRIPRARRGPGHPSPEAGADTSGPARLHEPGPGRQAAAAAAAQATAAPSRRSRWQPARALAPLPASVPATPRMPDYIPCASASPRPPAASAPPPPHPALPGACHVVPQPAGGGGRVRELPSRRPPEPGPRSARPGLAG